jgi:hypothetical protein
MRLERAVALVRKHAPRANCERKDFPLSGVPTLYVWQIGEWGISAEIHGEYLSRVQYHRKGFPVLSASSFSAALASALWREVGAEVGGIRVILIEPWQTAPGGGVRPGPLRVQAEEREGNSALWESRPKGEYLAICRQALDTGEMGPLLDWMRERELLPV